MSKLLTVLVIFLLLIFFLQAAEAADPEKIKEKCKEKADNNKNTDVKCRSEGTPEIPLYYVPFFMAGLFCVYSLVSRRSGE